MFPSIPAYPAWCIRPAGRITGAPSRVGRSRRAVLICPRLSTPRQRQNDSRDKFCCLMCGLPTSMSVFCSQRTASDANPMSAPEGRTDMTPLRADVGLWPILLQKSAQWRWSDAGNHRAECHGRPNVRRRRSGKPTGLSRYSEAVAGARAERRYCRRSRLSGNRERYRTSSRS